MIKLYVDEIKDDEIEEVTLENLSNNKGEEK
jgi:hypothetical protein